MTPPAGRSSRPVRAAFWLCVAAVVLPAAAAVWSFTGFVALIESQEVVPDRHADGAVALTGGADRITDAIDLLTAGRVDRLLITGVNPQTTQAEILRQRPNARAAFECCIELGYEAANTVGNAAETERWVKAHGIRSVVVVTSNYHMPRALAEFASAIPDTELLPFPVVSDRARTRPWWIEPQSTRLIVTEWAKYVAASTRLLLTPRPPAAGSQASLERHETGEAGH